MYKWNSWIKWCNTLWSYWVWGELRGAAGNTAVTVWTRWRGAGPRPVWSSLLRCCGQCVCWERGTFLHWPAALSHSGTSRPAYTPGHGCQHSTDQYEGKSFGIHSFWCHDEFIKPRWNEYKQVNQEHEPIAHTQSMLLISWCWEG